MTKDYKVNVLQRYIYEAKADTPEDAKAQVINRDWAGNYDDVALVEVLRVCECGNSNDVHERNCDECGANL